MRDKTTLFLVFSLAIANANAATIRGIDDDLFGPTIDVTGQIVKGDYDKFQKVASHFVLESEFPLRLNLNSSGGDVEEAIKIGRLARKLLANISVYGNSIVDPSSTSAKIIRKSISEHPRRERSWNHRRIISSSQPLNEQDIVRCYSACVLIFFGGTERTVVDNQDDRQGRNEIPVMGIHRPYFDKQYFSVLNPQEASLEYKRLEMEVEGYLREMGATSDLMERMLRKASNEVELVRSKDFKAFFRPVEPFLDEFLLAKCGSAAEKDFLDPNELRDFELLSKELIEEFVRRERVASDLAQNARVFEDPDEYVPDGFDAAYASQLRNKVAVHKGKVDSCRKNAVLSHQIDWALGILLKDKKSPPN